MNVKKILGVLAIVLLIFFVITRPDGAARSWDSIAASLNTAATSITNFFTDITT